MTKSIKTLLCAAGVVALSACTQGTIAEFYSEAGVEVDEGRFGNPTMINTNAHIAGLCAGQAKGYIVPDPIVVLDPSSTPENPVYRRGHVRCLELNGKYAEVIWAEYVQSATQVPPFQGVGIGSGDGGGG